MMKQHAVQCDSLCVPASSGSVIFDLSKLSTPQLQQILHGFQTQSTKYRAVLSLSKLRRRKPPHSDIQTPTRPIFSNAVELDDDCLKKSSFTFTSHQQLVRKRLKECGKRLNSHKRVPPVEYYQATVDEEDGGVGGDGVGGENGETVAAHDFEEVEDVHDMEEFDEGDEEDGDDDIDDPEEDEEEPVAMDSDSDDEPVVTRGRNAGECLASFQFQTASVSERFEQFRAILESDGIDFGSLSGNMFA
ncbi:hypothetical protein BJ741DRAFT_583189 [Chytriomyces cf. hyalinus JEL632]|nr:hypothetical protein BJ741DRAFT_583189 [Chytriomyces cf. hyalinus JEL632]